MPAQLRGLAAGGTSGPPFDLYLFCCLSLADIALPKLARLRCSRSVAYHPGDFKTQFSLRAEICCVTHPHSPMSADEPRATSCSSSIRRRVWDYVELTPHVVSGSRHNRVVSPIAHLSRVSRMVGEDSIRRSGLRGLIAEPNGETDHPTANQLRSECELPKVDRRDDLLRINLLKRSGAVGCFRQPVLNFAC